MTRALVHAVLAVSSAYLGSARTLSGPQSPGSSGGGLPIFMLHGVSSGAGEMATIQRVAAAHGITATSLPLYEGKVDSLAPLHRQVQGVVSAIRARVAANASLYARGYNLVCKSQGGLICRCVVEEMDDHRVHTFVSLAGPQMGVWGQQFFAQAHFPAALRNLTANEVWRVAYTAPLQDTLSVANMWNDPHQQADFLEHNKFLPLYNGLKAPAATIARYKHNFLRLQQATFCVGSGSPYDGGIEPWQSGAWGFVDGSAEGAGRTVPMSQHQVYTADTFGLRTLDETHFLGRYRYRYALPIWLGYWTVQ
eukprot:SAG25_NODE_379_length_8822_cov_7.896366_8_plen_308_part_00